MNDLQTTLLLVAALIPLAVAILMYVVKDAKLAGRLVMLSSWFQLALLLYLTMPLFAGLTEKLLISKDFFLAPLDAGFVVLTLLVAAAAFTHGSIFYERELQEEQAPTSGNIRLNYACAVLFVLAMCGVYFCKNLGYLWVCVESTTLLSAPLVYFSRTKHALEATWKYLIICSVGISFALLGTLFIFASSQHGAVPGGSLRFDELVESAGKLDAKLLRFGFIFCLLGYGTKCGMFPLHGWLPDAHSEAPAPSSALLSGSLLNCALFAIFQIGSIALASGSGLAFLIALWGGTVTVVAASLFLIRQHALKRLFAYSSIENVGVMLMAIGLNVPWLFLFQAVNHSISKVSLFLLSGNIVQATGKKGLAEQSGVMASAPAWGILLALSVFAATGAPPFGTFLSELLVLVKAFESNHSINAVLLLFAISLSFIVVCMHVGRVLLGAKSPQFDYFRPIASSIIPLGLVLLSLCLGLMVGPVTLGALSNFYKSMLTSEVVFPVAAVLSNASTAPLESSL